MKKNKVNKELLDKVLADLNLTEQQMLDEGMWDRVKAAGSAFANPQQIAVAQAASDLKANTLQTIEKLKALANTLEAQANAMPNISPKQASAIYAQLNAFIVSSIKSAQSAMASSPQQPAATVAPAPTVPVVAPGTPSAQVNLGGQTTATIPGGPNLGVQPGVRTPPVAAPAPILPPGSSNFTYGGQQTTGIPDSWRIPS
jgi:hypothetical protein